MFDKTTITADVLRGYMASLPQKQFTGISPSSLGGCLRAHFYKLRGVSATTPPVYGALVNFEMGRLWEAFLARAYEQQGTLHKWFQDGVEAPWSVPELNLVGTPDLIVKDASDELVIVDSKTMRSEWFQYTKKYKTFDDFVRDNYSYVMQQVCYILLARENGYPKMRKAVLSFASKDDGYVGQEIEITATTALVNEVRSRIAELNGYLERDEVPPCECEGWKIGYCDYGDPHTRTFNKKGKEINTSCCHQDLYSSLKSDDKNVQAIKEA